MQSKVDAIKYTQGYQLISAFYGNDVAKRSQVPLINHINEGLLILGALGASTEEMVAYAIHPMVQSDEVFKESYPTLARHAGALALLLAVEYRNVANDYLSYKISNQEFQPIRLSPIAGVNAMLIADKVQNFKDFQLYHQGTHERSDELTRYFQKWLTALGVSDVMYHNLVEICS